LRDRPLGAYRAKRDFTRTPEPAPGRAAAAGSGPIFVVQKHDASRLHWDFRLEHGGVLWSWAVPKGPSLDPRDKRLAVHVEDHPLDYAGFEGVIPEGNYGAGVVEIWDRGTWEPQGDPEEGLRRGELKFVLHGSRLRGGFVLVRLKPRGRERAENWLLIKEHDGFERPGADAAVLERSPLAPAADPPDPPAPDPLALGRYGWKAPPGAVRAPLPATQAPMLATNADAPPEGPEWLVEVKFDGYRLLGFKEGGKVRLLTRTGQDWTARLPATARAVAALPAETLLVDGELVALRPDGVSSFPELQAALSDGRDAALHLYLFDLLHRDGWDLRDCALTERKAALAALERVREAGKTPILCGGTGMYLHALLHGIAELPDPGPKAREEARALLARLGPHGLHARLAELDPETAAGLRPSDSQRLARAYEVWLGTGRGLKSWQSEPAEQLTGWSPRMILLDPPRAALRTAALARFAAMLKAGGLEEVRHLLEQDHDPALPILRAHGVPELAAHLRGQISLAEASHRAALATHQYAKRQATWFRHHALAGPEATRKIDARVDGMEQFSEHDMAGMTKFICEP